MICVTPAYCYFLPAKEIDFFLETFTENDGLKMRSYLSTRLCTFKLTNRLFEGAEVVER